jgi:hypothetical protein
MVLNGVERALHSCPGYNGFAQVSLLETVVRRSTLGLKIVKEVMKLKSGHQLKY